MVRRGHQRIGNPTNAAKIVDNKRRMLTIVLVPFIVVAVAQQFSPPRGIT